MRTKTSNSASATSASNARTQLGGVLKGTVRSMLMALALAGGLSSEPALARSVIIEIAPPPARVEVVPVQRAGYAWAPGYWAWQGNQHVWVKGHTMHARHGYQWAPDGWKEVNGRHEFERGRWTRSSEQHG